MKEKRNVRILNSIDSIRLRPGMFVGDTSNCNHLIHELIDNSLDEIRNKFGDTISLNFSKKGDVLICDNGRGLPSGETIDENTGEKVDALESLFTKLHSGTKFSFDSDQLESLFGQNGVGLVAVNALSEYVEVLSKKNHYRFVDSKLVVKETVDPSDIWSTQIMFRPNKQYFDSIAPDYNTFLLRCRLAQAKLENIKFIFNKKELKRESFSDFVRNVLHISKNTPLFECSFKTTKMKVVEPVTNKEFVLPGSIVAFITYEPGETVITGDVNLRFCDGVYINNVVNIIKANLLSKLDKKYSKTPERFLIEGLRLYISLQMPFPKFDSQTKTRMISDVKKEIIDGQFESKIIKILGEQYIKDTVSKILSQKLNNITKIVKKKISSENKLCDCSQQPGDVLYIIEGDSAAAPVRECRDASREAYLPLRGKVINIEKQSLHKIKENKEIKNIIEAIGAPPHRYEKIKIVADADCLSGDTIIHFQNFKNEYVSKEISKINIDEIKYVQSFNFITGNYEYCRVNRIIDKEANKDFIEFTLHLPSYDKIRAYTTHGFPVYNIDEKKIQFLNADQIDKDIHVFISNKKCTADQYKLFSIDEKLDLYGISIDNIRNIGKLDRAYCLEVEKTHNFTIGNNQILTFNCDGLHINVLVILLINKFFPDIIKEGRLSVVLPPLYGAYKNKTFIPLYNITDANKYAESGYSIQRFKGLGEMNSDQMRAVFDSETEYVISESSHLDELLKIITNSDVKRQYLNLEEEYNFKDFIQTVFNNLNQKRV